MSQFKTLMVISLMLICGHATAAGKLLATPGVSQVEGAGGGGLVPWAPIAGYATDDQWSTSAFCSRVTVKDFRLGVCGVQVNFYDRAEMSYAKQTFRVEPLSLDLEQSITGIKVRLFGDLVYSPWPVVSAGVQHKQMQKNKAVAVSLGAEETSGTDYYFAEIGRAHV